MFVCVCVCLFVCVCLEPYTNPQDLLKIKVRVCILLRISGEDSCRIDNPPFSTKIVFKIYVRGDPYEKNFKNFIFSETYKMHLKR